MQSKYLEKLLFQPDIGQLNDLHITEEQVNEIEKITKTQYASDNWYNQTAGRVTASKFNKKQRILLTVSDKNGLLSYQNVISDQSN